MMSKDIEIGCFVSPHGLGHATRVCAILEALQDEVNGLLPHFFTTVRESIFQESLDHYIYHHVRADIGLVQHDGLRADLDGTVASLNELLPYSERLVDELAHRCRKFSFILCDIAPLGIAVAQRANIPSILIENFTWDWIYQPYINKNQQMEPFSRYFGNLFEQADYHIQTEPVCRPAATDLRCGPIFRSIRTERQEIRNRLGCLNQKLVFISMGGIDLALPFTSELKKFQNILFVLAGQRDTKQEADNIVLLSRQSGYFHPDLINAADLVLCKSGYSTIAECYQASVAVGCVSREVFPESKVLERFIVAEMNGTIIPGDEFLTGKWLEGLNNLLDRKVAHKTPVNGATEVAGFLLPLL